MIGRKTFSVIEIDGTKYVCLPKEFVTSRGLKKGDKIEALFNDEIIIYQILKTEILEKEIKQASHSLTVALSQT